MTYYISCSKKEDRIKVKVIQMLKSHKIEASCYERGEYDEHLLEKADACVFILPDNAFEYALEKLNSGCLFELVYCLNTRKPIFIAYKNRYDEYKIYGARITDRLTVQGIAETSYNVARLEEIKLENKKEEISNLENFY